MTRLSECVPNFSEGRDSAKVEAIVAAMSSVPGVYVLDREMDADHNRCVVTLAGDPDAVAEAALLGVGKAAELIDLTVHQGAHPRVGATDVVPFIPIEGVTLDDCVALARRVGNEIWRRHRIPVFFYEAAATRPERVNLENVRRGQFEGIRDEIATDHGFGDRMFDLEAGVHLEEVGPAIVGDEELTRARAPISDRVGESQRGVGHPGTEAGVEARRGRLLEDFLVAALERAVPLAEVDPGAEIVEQDLDLDMTRPLEEALKDDPVVPEGHPCLPARRRDRILEAAHLADDPHGSFSFGGCSTPCLFDLRHNCSMLGVGSLCGYSVPRLAIAF